jgi:hypothetical protein
VPIRRTRNTAVEEAKEKPSPRSLIASAVNVDYNNLLSWRGYNLGRDEAWQRELWRLYDVIGEFRFGANWIGSACSRVAIGIYDIDENGEVGPRSTDPRVRALETTLLGGPAAQSEALRLMGINLTVAGEMYLVGRSGRGDEEDKWYVVTPSELTRWAGGVMYDYGAGPMQLIDNVDMLVRIWTPHPRRVWYADSPARGVMNVLIEIERLTRYVFSQIDSRLVSAGMLFIPDDMDFPDVGDEPTTASDSMMAKLAQAGEASLKGDGSATGVLPMIAEIPGEYLGKIQLVNFASELSKEAKELREEAINRFAYGMDFPPEILKGTGQTNHWASWNITDQTIKIHIEPIMTRIVDALTSCVLRPFLKKIGLDPKKYVVWYDTSGVITRPNRLTDAINLYKEQLLSGAAVREAGFFREDEAMPLDEQTKIFMEQLMLRDPTIFQSAAARELVGITEKMLPPDAITPPPPPPPPGSGALPQNAIGTVPQRPAEPPARPGVTASVSPVSLALVAGADLAVRRALELAGGRLMDRTHRFPDTPKHELHTKIRVVDDAHAQRVLGGAWTHIPALSEMLGDVDAGRLTEVLDAYTTAVLVIGRSHRSDDLLDMLRKEGLVDG